MVVELPLPGLLDPAGYQCWGASGASFNVGSSGNYVYNSFKHCLDVLLVFHMLILKPSLFRYASSPPDTDIKTISV